MDYLGVNYYFRQYAKWTPNERNEKIGSIGCEDVTPIKSGKPQTLCGWEIDDDELYDTLMRIHHRYPSIPLHATEAGMSHWDTVSSDGKIHDIERIGYLERQFTARSAPFVSDADLRGFSVWTFLDNWEWMDRLDCQRWPRVRRSRYARAAAKRRSALVP